MPINIIQKKKETSAKNDSAIPQKKGKEIIDPAASQSSSVDKVN